MQANSSVATLTQEAQQLRSSLDDALAKVVEVQATARALADEEAATAQNIIQTLE